MSKADGGHALFLDYLKTAVLDSLLDEVYTTPKPGLVDLLDCGAHRDMDVHTFEASAAAITPYLAEMAERGLSFDGEPEALFSSIRPVGVDAERAMFEATRGVNTHKGAVFSMGLMAAAAGAVFVRSGRIEAGETLDYCSRMCRGPLKAEFEAIRSAGKNPRTAFPEKPPGGTASRPRGPAGTHGELLYLRYGARGVRGEAADGFPHVRDCSLPVLRELSSQVPPPGRAGHRRYAPEEDLHVSWNRVCLQTLLHLMAAVDDTNVLHRTGPETLGYVRAQAARILGAGGSLSPEGIERLRQMNLDFIEKNISPGGCADLLAITLFLRRLELYRSEGY